MHRLVTTLALSVTLLALSGASAGAQQRRSTIRGTVVSARDLTPIAGVSVALVGAGRSVRTDLQGAFVFDSLVAGTYLVQVRWVADETPMTPVPVRAREIVDLEVKLGKPDAVMLPELVTVAPVPVTPGDAIEGTRLPPEFLAHRKTGLGQFITRDEIQARRPPTVLDLLRTVRGMGVTCRSGVCTPRAARAPGCSPIVVIDRMATDATVLASMVPNDIEAIEVYLGLSEAPIEYLRPRDRPQCGVIVVWTRVPPQKHPNP